MIIYFLCVFSIVFAAESGLPFAFLDAPFAWENTTVGVVQRYLKEPRSVGLEYLYVEQNDDHDMINIKNLKGDVLLCKVNSCEVFLGAWIFDIYGGNEEKKDFLAKVVSQPYNDDRGRISVFSFSEEKEADCQETFSTCPNKVVLDSRRYDVDFKQLVVKKLFAKDSDGNDFFVSATFAYEDLQTVVIRFGQRGENYRILEEKVLCSPSFKTV